MKHRRSLHLFLIVSLLVPGLVLAGGASASASIEVGVPFNLSPFPNPQNYADIDGSVAVWQDGRNGTCGDDGSGWDIWMHDFATGEDRAVTTSMRKQQYPRISDERIVYQSDEDCEGWPQDSNIYLEDLYTGDTEVIAMRQPDQEVPDISGSVVVWAEYFQLGKSDWDIYAYDLESHEEIQLTSDTGWQYYPRVSGDIVVWEDDRDDWSRDIWAYDLSEGSEFAICSASGSQWNPVVEDSIVAWIDSRDGYDAIYTYDLESDEESEVVTSDGSISGLEIGDGILIWSDSSTGGGDVYTYDTATGVTTQITDEEGCDGMPAISDGVVVWNHYMDVYPDGGAPDVFAVALRELPGFAATAMAGAGRYETAVDVSKKAFYRGADTAIIATGENWPDALGASALAGVYNAPILLTRTDALPAAVIAEIARLGADDVFVIGGKSAVSDTVIAQLDALVTGSVVRLGGSNRYETATIVASQTVAANPEWDGTAFVTTGLNFPDALSASPLAAKAGWPIFLTDAAGLSAGTEAAMADIGVTEMLLLGGTGVVPKSVGAAGNSERLGGINRYGTAVAIATYGEQNLEMRWHRFGLATGEDFPDALTAGVALGKYSNPLLLTPPTYLDSTTAAAIAAHKLECTSVWFIGGTKVMSQTVRNEVVGMIPES